MKKRIALLLFAVCSLSFLISIALAASYPCDGTIIKSAVNMRSGPSTKKDIVGKLKNNEAVTVLEETNVSNTIWYYVQTSKGTKGYVRGDLLRIETDRISAPISSSTVTNTQTVSETSENNISRFNLQNPRDTMWLAIDLIENGILANKEVYSARILTTYESMKTTATTLRFNGMVSVNDCEFVDIKFLCTESQITLSDPSIEGPDFSSSLVWNYDWNGRFISSFEQNSDILLSFDQWILSRSTSER